MILYRFNNFYSAKLVQLIKKRQFSRDSKFVLNSRLLKCVALTWQPRILNRFTKHFSQIHNLAADDVRFVRNVGLIAHVDAGKTTTTERMLYCAGATSTMGDVDDGDTVTDYMDQERERGITITSAAVAFRWKNHKFNLVDTPGHVDFTVEVERTLCALDGAVVVLDASAGVQAQTLTVCRQARRYRVPQIVYVNKIDKLKVTLQNCIDSIENKLKMPPLLIHHPVFSKEVLLGIIDVVALQYVTWDPRDLDRGKSFRVCHLTESYDKELWSKALQLRKELIEDVADLDDEVADYVLTHEDFTHLDSAVICRGLRRITLQQKGLVIFCGSSLKNIGVPLLMDGIVDYLPSPFEHNCKNVRFYDDELCALLFKVIIDKQKGLLLFLRLYNGTLKQGQKIYNVNKDITEKVAKLFVAFADEFREVENVTGGNIVVATGLKLSTTGDTIVANSGAAVKAARRYGNLAENSKGVAPLVGDLHVPDPVFFCSIEPSSLSHQKTLDVALENLKREDPSLQVKDDEETGQKIISGMGELHLNIIEERIKREYKADVYLGPLQVAYKEAVQNYFEHKSEMSRTINNVKSHILLKLSVEPTTLDNKFMLVRSGENQENLAELRKSHLLAIENGVMSALERGPLLGYPMIRTSVGLHWAEIRPGSVLSVIAAMTSHCLSAAILQANPGLLEPFMQLEITAPSAYLHDILGDLSRRRGQIVEISVYDDMKVLNVLVPLAELMGYSTVLRKISSGLATFTMEFKHYELMSSNEQRKAIQKITGFV